MPTPVKQVTMRYWRRRYIRASYYVVMVVYPSHMGIDANFFLIVLVRSISPAVN